MNVYFQAVAAPRSTLGQAFDRVSDFKRVTAKRQLPADRRKLFSVPSALYCRKFTCSRNVGCVFDSGKDRVFVETWKTCLPRQKTLRNSVQTWALKDAPSGEEPVSEDSTSSVAKGEPSGPETEGDHPVVSQPFSDTQPGASLRPSNGASWQPSEGQQQPGEQTPHMEQFSDTHLAASWRSREGQPGASWQPSEGQQPMGEQTPHVEQSSNAQLCASCQSSDGQPGASWQPSEGQQPTGERMPRVETAPPPGGPATAGGAGQAAAGGGESVEVDKLLWDGIRKIWDNPAFVKFRVSLSLANLTMALPTFLARISPIIATAFQQLQLNLHTLNFLNFFNFLNVPSQVSLPILAPLLFGSGIAFKSITSNLGYVLPRLGMAVCILWLVWGVNYAVQMAIRGLRDRGAVDRRVSNALVLFVELTASAIAVVTVLSSVGVKISSLLMPFFLALALAGKDVWQNYFAGFFLFAAQPFRPGDTVAMMCGIGLSGGPSSMAPASHVVLGPGWFEGVCESVDLRYTVLRSGRHRLMVPNSRFVNREFLVTDIASITPPPRRPSPRTRWQSSVNHAGGQGPMEAAAGSPATAPSSSVFSAWPATERGASGEAPVPPAGPSGLNGASRGPPPVVASNGLAELMLGGEEGHRLGSHPFPDAQGHNTRPKDDWPGGEGRGGSAWGSVGQN